MTERIVGLLLISLSAAVLHCVSAGGAYCAKSARARAAALGLDYPGDHGAPDLSGPPRYEQHPPRAPHQFLNNPQPAVMDYNLLYNLPTEFSYPQPAIYGSHGLDGANPLSSLSGAESVNNRRANFEQVKRVGPLTQARAPGQADLVKWASESHNKPLPFVYNWRDLAVDASVPNRHGTVMSGRSLPQIPGYGIYYLVYPAGAKPGASFPTVARQSQVPGHSAWPLYERLNIKPQNPSHYTRKR